MVFRKIILIKFFFGFLCAVISELIHYSAAGSSSGLPVHMPLIQVIVPQVMNLKAQLRDSSKVLLSQISPSFVSLIYGMRECPVFWLKVSAKGYWQLDCWDQLFLFISSTSSLPHCWILLHFLQYYDICMTAFSVYIQQMFFSFSSPFLYFEVKCCVSFLRFFSWWKSYNCKVMVFWPFIYSSKHRVITWNFFLDLNSFHVCSMIFCSSIFLNDKSLLLSR